MKKIVVSVLALLLIPLTVTARPPRDERAQDRVRTFLVLRLSEELDLSDEKALEVSRIIKKETSHRGELRNKRTAVEEKIRSALERSPLEAGEISRLVQEANQIDEEFALLSERTLREVQKVLTPEQQARLVLFRPELREQMRKALRKRFREGKHGGRGERLAGY